MRKGSLFAALLILGATVMSVASVGLTQLDAAATPVAPNPIVYATVETTPVPNGGDAADDIAIYANPNNPAMSVVIGTNKNIENTPGGIGGLAVYDMNGSQIQYLEHGKMNNVDIRTGFSLGGQSVILVTATNRTQNRIEAYTLNPSTRMLTNVTGSTSTNMGDIYGYCMYKSPITNKFHGFVTSDEQSIVKQFEFVDAGNGKVNAVSSNREINIGYKTEGCVADDETARLYTAVENEDIRWYPAEPNAANPSTKTIVSEIDDVTFKADVEGLAILYGPNGTGYLFASNQGNNSYSVYTREGNNTYLGDFKIASGAIDGTNDTDGIDVTGANLGPNFPNGAFIAQDGTNQPVSGAHQNFKMVPLEDILSEQVPPTGTTVTQNPVADTYVSSAAPSANFGQEVELSVDAQPQDSAYFKFDLSSLSDKNITSAKLSMYLDNGSSEQFSLKEVGTSTWGELTMTNDNKPAVGSTIGSVSGPAVNSRIEFNVTASAQALKGGLASWALVSDGVTDGIDILSRESSSNKPQLVVTYESDPTPPQSTTVTKNAVADSYVTADAPTTNYGSSSTLFANAPTTFSYLKFDLGDLASKNVTSAKVRLYLTNGSSGSYSIKEVTDSSWTESGITYNNRPDRTTLYGTMTDTEHNSWVEVDLTSAVTSYKGGPLSIGIASTSTQNGIEIASKEAGANQPQLVVTYASDPTPPQQTTVTKSATADAYVTADAPTTNYGSSSTLFANAPTTFSYVKFDLSDLASRTITSAKVRLYLTNGSSGSYSIKEVANSSWTESGITYNNRPDRTTLYGTMTDTKHNSWVEVDLTSAVANYKGGQFSIGIASTSTQNGIEIASKEAGANQPQLVVTYE